MKKKLRIAWVCFDLRASTASARYRCYYPAIALEALDVQSEFFSKPWQVTRVLDRFDVIVFVKLFDAHCLALATLARAKGAKVIVDLCDNVVVSSYQLNRARDQIPFFAGLAAIADAVVTPSPALADDLKEFAPAYTRFLQIPDQIETRETIAAAERLSRVVLAQTAKASLRQKIGRMRERLAKDIRHPRRLIRSLAMEAGTKASDIVRKLLAPKRVEPSEAQSPVSYSDGTKRVLWFGNGGAPHSDFGMLALLKAAHALESISHEIDFELVVVSNDRARFESFIARLPIKTRHRDWSPQAVFEELEHASVCLLPFGVDQFSLTKSANRIVMSLAHGVPVVTSSIRSLEPLRNVVVLDDWEKGLRRYLLQPASAREDVTNAREILESDYSVQSIGRLWMDLLLEPVTRRMHRKDGRLRIAIALNLAQDLDVLLPLVDELSSDASIQVKVLVSSLLPPQSPRVARALAERAIIPYLVGHSAVLRGDDRCLRDVDVLITASESNLRPHGFCHQLVIAANALGIATFTLQHGLENVGLTYFDEIHGTDVEFASSRILTWGDPSDLPSHISSTTRAKCVPVGRTARVAAVSLSGPAIPWSAPAVGIFENLHWHRYSDSYRQQFIQDLLATVRANPSITFVLKPHHAGRFTARRFAELFGAAPPNLILLDPREKRWEPFTAPAIIRSCDAVITTPSTVALDAAEMGVPVAVAGYDVDVEIYNPLPVIRTTSDWDEFLLRATSKGSELREFCSLFVKRSRRDGDAVKRIVELLQSERRLGRVERRVLQAGDI